MQCTFLLCAICNAGWNLQFEIFVLYAYLKCIECIVLRRWAVIFFVNKIIFISIANSSTELNNNNIEVP